MQLKAINYILFLLCETGHYGVIWLTPLEINRELNELTIKQKSVNCLADIIIVPCIYIQYWFIAFFQIPCLLASSVSLS